MLAFLEATIISLSTGIPCLMGKKPGKKVGPRGWVWVCLHMRR